MSWNRNGLTPGSDPRGNPLVARNSAENDSQVEGLSGLIEQGWAAELDIAPRGLILRVPALHPHDVLRRSCLDRHGEAAAPGADPGEERRVEARLPKAVRGHARRVARRGIAGTWGGQGGRRRSGCRRSAHAGRTDSPASRWKAND